MEMMSVARFVCTITYSFVIPGAAFSTLSASRILFLVLGKAFKLSSSYGSFVLKYDFLGSNFVSKRERHQ